MLFIFSFPIWFVFFFPSIHTQFELIIYCFLILHFNSSIYFWPIHFPIIFYRNCSMCLLSQSTYRQYCSTSCKMWEIYNHIILLSSCLVCYFFQIVYFSMHYKIYHIFLILFLNGKCVLKNWKELQKMVFLLTHTFSVSGILHFFCWLLSIFWNDFSSNFCSFAS